MPRLVGPGQIVVCLVIITMVAAGCAGSPSASTSGSVSTPLSKSNANPPASTYPADISGSVLVVDKVKYVFPNSTSKLEEIPIGNDAVWWIVEVSAQNKDYAYPMKAIWDKSMPMPKGISSNIIWSIIIDGKVWSGTHNETFIPPAMSVSKGQSGTTRFLFEAKKNMNLGDAEIRYAGEEPYSYGKLTGGDKVAVYDLDLKKAVPEELVKTARTIESWEFTLNSISITSTNIILNITVTSHYDTIKTYFSSITGEIGTRELVVVDQYGGIFVDRTDKPFYEGQYYPEDSKTGNLKFAVNPKSGKVELWIIPSTSGLLATYNQNKLFDLGEIK